MAKKKRAPGGDSRANSRKRRNKREPSRSERRRLRGDKRPGIGGEVPTEGVLRVDLHGLNRYKARDYVEDMIKSADDMSSPPTYLLFIHGYRKGTVMRGVVRQAAERMHKRWDNHPHNRGATYVTL